jgi:hypothetical protein
MKLITQQKRVIFWSWLIIWILRVGYTFYVNRALLFSGHGLFTSDGVCVLIEQFA